MKKHMILISAILFSFGLILSSCEKEPVPGTDQGSILPEKFSVEIPGALSLDGGKKATAAIDTLNGNLVYLNLVTFIAVGAGGGEIVEDIIKGLWRYNIDKPMTLTFKSDDDGRDKNVVVTENPVFEGIQWEFGLSMTDAGSEGAADGGYAMQIFWNRSPRRGIAILKPYNINRNGDPGTGQAVGRIDYSEAGGNGYEAQMLVEMADLPVPSPLKNAFAINSLKMFVGKKDGIVDVYGNSNHPNATFFDGEKGFNWAFAAAGTYGLNIAVAEVGLPPSDLDESSREVLLETYSVKNVFSNQIFSLWPNINPDDVDAFLHNTEAPGYFNSNGFVRGGTAPDSRYEEIESHLPLLSPFNPSEVAGLGIEFKMD